MLLVSAAGNFPIDKLVHEEEQRNRLKLILPWLEARVQNGSQDPAVFNAMAKIYIDYTTLQRSLLQTMYVVFFVRFCMEISQPHRPIEYVNQLIPE